MKGYYSKPLIFSYNLYVLSETMIGKSNRYTALFIK